MQKIITILLTIFTSLFLIACTNNTPTVSENTPPTPTIEKPPINQPTIETVEKQYDVYKTEDIPNQRNVMIIVNEGMTSDQIRAMILGVSNNECRDIKACVIDVHGSKESARLSVERQTIPGGEFLAWEEENRPVIDKYWRGFFYVEDGKINEDNGYQPSIENEL